MKGQLPVDFGAGSGAMNGGMLLDAVGAGVGAS